MISIDLEKGTVTNNERGTAVVYPISSPEAFKLISKAWLRCGWDTKYVYGFSWLGRPIIQLPEDLVRVQEVIYALQPSVIIETGIAHGGSLIFYASLCRMMGKGRVIGIDVEIRPHNRKAIEAHDLFQYITLVEGSSTDDGVVQKVRSMVTAEDKVFVMLDSNHTKAHVLAELQSYAGLVSVGSYIVAADGIMEEVVGAPRTKEDWTWNNPKVAAAEFVAANPSFVLEAPSRPFNEGLIKEPVTYWPGAWIRRIK
jgi:cephalosporin hydroxylase